MQQADKIIVLVHTPHPTQRPHSCCYLANKLTSINFTCFESTVRWPKSSCPLALPVPSQPALLFSSWGWNHRKGSDSLRRSPLTNQSAAVDTKPGINMAPSAYRLSVCEACRAATASLRKDARTAASQSQGASSAQRRDVSQWESPELPSLCPTVAVPQHIFKVIIVNKHEQSCGIVDMFTILLSEEELCVPSSSFLSNHSEHYWQHWLLLLIFIFIKILSSFLPQEYMEEIVCIVRERPRFDGSIRASCGPNVIWFVLYFHSMRTLWCFI